MKLFQGLFAFLFLSGCSVYMAAKQPDAKNIDLFAVGTPRAAMLAEFGLPAVSETRNGRKYEIFKFVNGYSAGAKAGRAVFHGAADVLTLGLWEVVATPTEGIFSGDEMAFVSSARLRKARADRASLHLYIGAKSHQSEFAPEPVDGGAASHPLSHSRIGGHIGAQPLQTLRVSA